jgi:hypothetical protein
MYLGVPQVYRLPAEIHYNLFTIPAKWATVESAHSVCILRSQTQKMLDHAGIYLATRVIVISIQPPEIE